MASAANGPVQSRRERLREQTLAEIKALALQQVAESGAEALSLNRIARDMGMSGPGIYRYFPSRASLLDALVADLYAQLGEALAAAVTAARRRTPAGRLHALADTYRAFALEHRRAYQLMTNEADPAPDGQASQVPVAATRSMELIVSILADIAGPDRPTAPEDDPLSQSLHSWARARDHDVAAPVLRLGVLTWSRLHGLVSLEITGVFATMGIDAEALYRSEVDGLAREAAALAG